MKHIILFFSMVVLLLPNCKKMDSASAAQLACNLANQECQKLYQRQPFKPDTYPAKYEKQRWHWGSLDIVGIGGLSAEVSFLADGSDPQVKVYLTTDDDDPRGMKKEFMEQIKPSPKKRDLDLPPDIIKE